MQIMLTKHFGEILVARWRWSLLTKVIQHPVSLIAARLPIVIFIIFLLAKLDQVPGLRELLGVKLRTTLSMNASLLLIGSTLIFIAWLLYTLSCPRDIKRHPDFETYVTEQSAIDYPNQKLAKASLLAVVEKTNNNPSNYEANWRSNAPKTLSGLYSAQEVTHGAHQNARNASQYYWHLLEGSKGWLVMIIWALLFVGVTSAGVPTIRTMYNAVTWLILPEAASSS